MQLINNQSMTMSSIEIADLTGKRHDNVISDINKMLSSLGLNAPDFSGTQMYGNNNMRDVFYLPKRETLILISGYNVELRAKIIDRWQELEAQQKPALPKSYAEALLEAGRLALENERKDEQLRLAAPKVEFVDNFVEASSGSMGFRKLAKLLEIKENEFRHFLTKNSIMYRLGGDWVPYQNHIDAGRFEVKAGLKEHETGNSHAFSQSNFTAKGIKWIAGLLAQDKIDRINRDLAKQE